MIILGLGSNMGDRLENLRNAISRIQRLSQITITQISPIYVSDALLPENAPQHWDRGYLNCAISCETSLNPGDLLVQIQNIEMSLGRSEHLRWGPRIIDIDILAWHAESIQTKSLTVPHPHLCERPFALWPLADIAPFWRHPDSNVAQNKTAAECVESWGSRFDGKAPFHTQQIAQRIQKPQLMGILNLTPDSFSDGGQFNDLSKATSQALHLGLAGAEIIDIGAESTAPKAEAITPEVEWDRLKFILQAILPLKTQFIIPPKISVDTRHHYVAERALSLGVDLINDVSGLDDVRMRELIKECKNDCIIMHHITIPERRKQVLPRDDDPVKQVYLWAHSRLKELEHAGIDLGRIIFDPGIGFGKMAEQSLHILKNMHEFKSLNTRILIGHSRKTFLSLFTNKPFIERDIETTALALKLARKSDVDYLRIHNVEMCSRALKASDGL